VDNFERATRGIKKMVIPKSAIGAISGLYYKIGSHGFAFMWLKGEWIKSERGSGGT